MSTRKGRRYEEEASRALEELGLLLLERNYHTPFGELDIIAKDGNCLCFVEVKGRYSASEWNIDSIPESKQRKIIASIEYYLQQKGDELSYQELEIGAFFLEGGKCTFLRDAFDGF